MDVKREVQPLVRRNQGKSSATDAYAAFARQEQSSTVRMQVSQPASGTSAVSGCSLEVVWACAAVLLTECDSAHGQYTCSTKLRAQHPFVSYFKHIQRRRMTAKEHAVTAACFCGSATPSMPVNCAGCCPCYPDICSCKVTEALAVQDAVEAIVDMREYDVPYHVRFCIDSNIRCGHWFTVKALVSCSCRTSASMESPHPLHIALRRQGADQNFR